MPNNRLHTDKIKLRSFLTPLYFAGEARRYATGNKSWIRQSEHFCLCGHCHKRATGRGDSARITLANNQLLIRKLIRKPIRNPMLQKASKRRRILGPEHLPFDKTFDRRLKETYREALAAGLWKDKYAATDRGDYWAEGVQSWFDANRSKPVDRLSNSRTSCEEYPPMTLDDIRGTSDNKLAGSVRILLAVLFLMTGAMKLLVPMLAEAWSGQLLAANIPLHTVSRWTVPFLEMALGAVLTVGIFVRPAAVVVIGIMVVATYVHLVVDDPSLFPLQPSKPIIPLMVILMSVYVMWRGAGAWSLDLRATQAAA